MSAVLAVLRPARSLAVTLALGLGLGACGGPALPVATTGDVTRAQARWPSTTLEDLHRGRKLVVSRCGTCHQPPSPADHVAADWPDEVAEMAERSGLRPGEGDLLTRYLVTFARDQVVSAAPVD